MQKARTRFSPSRRKIIRTMELKRAGQCFNAFSAISSASRIIIQQRVREKLYFGFLLPRLESQNAYIIALLSAI